MNEMNKDGIIRKTESFLKGTLILTAAGIIVKVIGSLNWILLSRVLGGEGIGLYQMAFPIYLLALSISTAGIPVAISIITAEKLAFNDYSGAHRVFKVSLLLLSVSGLIFSILLFFGSELLVNYRIIRDVRAYYSLVALAPAIFFVTILASFRGYLQGHKIMTPTAVSQIVEQLFRVITMLVFASLLLPYGLPFAAAGASFGAFPGAVAGLVVVLFYYWRVAKVVRPKAETISHSVQESKLTIIKRIIKLALPVSAANLMLPVVANLDLIIVPVRLEAAGFTVEQATELFGYLTGMAVPLINLSTILTASLATSLIPVISEAFSLGRHQVIFQKTASVVRLANIITIPAAVGLYILATPIADLVYNAPKAGKSIEVLAVAIFLLGIHQITTGVLQGMGRTFIPMANMAISAGIKVYLNWLLTAVPTLGILGASWATVADIGIAAVLNVLYLRRHIGFTINLLELTKPIVAASIMGITMYWIFKYLLILTLSNSFACVGSMAAAIIVYGFVLLLVGGIKQQDLIRIPFAGSYLVRLANKTGRLK